MVDINKLKDAVSKLKSLSSDIETAIIDERQAQIMYKGLAGKAGQLSYIDFRFSSVANGINQIRDQEHNHEIRFIEIKNYIIKSINQLEKRIKELEALS